MSKRIYGSEFGFQTRAVHTGNDVDGETGAIKRPITMANSYGLPYDLGDLNRKIIISLYNWFWAPLFTLIYNLTPNPLAD